MLYIGRMLGILFCHASSAQPPVTLLSAGVSIKIEVASRFEKSIQLYQQGAVRPFF